MAMDKGPPKGPTLGDELGRPGKPLGAIPIGGEQFAKRLRKEARARDKLARSRRISLGLYATNKKVPLDFRVDEVRKKRKELLTIERENAQKRRALGLPVLGRHDPDATKVRGMHADDFTTLFSQGGSAEQGLRMQRHREKAKIATEVKTTVETREMRGIRKALGELVEEAVETPGAKFDIKTFQTLEKRANALREARINLGVLALDPSVPVAERQAFVRRERARILRRERELAKHASETGFGRFFKTGEVDKSRTAREVVFKRELQKHERVSRKANKLREDLNKEIAQQEKETEKFKREVKARKAKEKLETPLKDKKKARRRGLRQKLGFQPRFNAKVLDLTKKLKGKGPKKPVLTGIPVLDAAIEMHSGVEFLREEIKKEEARKKKKK
jgi:hypothetical protein